MSSSLSISEAKSDQLIVFATLMETSSIIMSNGIYGNALSTETRSLSELSAKN
jgi:hypothetical protein